MRWQALFDDLEGQWSAERDAELRAEVADRTRREAALVAAGDRLRPALGQQLVVDVLAAGPLEGVLRDTGPDWLLLEEHGRRDLLVPTAAVLSVLGLSARAATPGSEGVVARRLDLAWALRGLARERATVSVVLLSGGVLHGTLDRVGADHVELAEHPAGEARRTGAVRQVRLVPLTALALVRSS